MLMIDHTIKNLLTYFSATVLLVVASTGIAHASATADVLCSMVAILNGPLGIGTATLAVGSVGVAAILGRASWGMAVTVSIGISILFGAKGLTQLFTGTVPC